jgi:hypothetical protein
MKREEKENGQKLQKKIKYYRTKSNVEEVAKIGVRCMLQRLTKKRK